jgi:hypothetical protein
MPASRAHLRLPPAKATEFLKAAAAKYPAKIPPADTAWALEDGRLRYGSGRVEVTTAPMTVLGFFAESPATADRAASLMLKFEISETVEAAAGDPLWEWVKATFAPGGTLAGALEANFGTMVPAKQRPPGVTGKNVGARIKSDLETEQGKTAYGFPQMYKPRLLGDDDPPVPIGKFGPVKMYLTAGAGHGLPDREPGSVPEEVAKHFPPDHPVSQHFRDNPGSHPAERIPVTAADGDPSPWASIAAMSNKGARQYYTKAIASMTLGGINIMYLSKRQMFLANLYLNGRGFELFAVQEAGGGAGGSGPTENNDDLYGGPSAASLYDDAELGESPRKKARV